MTQDMTRGPDSTAGTREVARHEAGEVAHTAKDAGGQVAGTAADQARQVAGEVRDQARDLMHEGRQQVREQAVAGQQKAAGGLSSVADELRRMADGSDGVVGDLARQGADRAQEFATWLRDREPGDLVEEVRGWARQRPGTFLVGAALAGVLAGRLTRGTMAARGTGTTGTSGTGTSRTGMGGAGSAATGMGAAGTGATGASQGPGVPQPVTPATTTVPAGQPVTRGSYGAAGDPAAGVDPGLAAVPGSPYPATDPSGTRRGDLGSQW
jgi:hypothetical protein